MYEILPKQQLSKMRLGTSLKELEKKKLRLRNNSQEFNGIQNVDEMYTFLKR